MSTDAEHPPSPLAAPFLSPASLRLIPVHIVDAVPPSDTSTLRILFESILQWGILQPLVVRRAGARYEVLAGRKRFAAAIAAGLSEVPCVVFDVSDSEASALADATNVAPPPPPTAQSAAPSSTFLAVVAELHATRAAIAGSVALADSRSAGLRQHVARDLVDVELQRCAWMLDGLLAYRPTPSEQRGAVFVGVLLRSVGAAFQPECRLGGIEVRLLVEPSDLAVYGNEAQLRVALQCVAGALLTSMHVERHPEAILSLQAKRVAGAVVVSIAQNVVAFQRLARLRGGRRSDQEDSDPIVAAFGFDAAKRLVELHGGRLELRPDPASPGCVVDLKLPSGE